jgi:hypothetical protein
VGLLGSGDEEDGVCQSVDPTGNDMCPYSFLLDPN